MRKLFSKLAPKASGTKREQADVSTSGSPADAGSSTILTYDVTEKDLPRLHQAAWTGNLNKAKQYTKDDPNGLDNWGRTPLHLACAKGHLAVVKVLLQRNASPNIQDRDGRTPLIKAVQGLHEPCIEFLLQFGCNTNISDDRGCTSLHYAAACGASSTTVALLEKGSNINHQNKAGQTALYMACEQQQFATCQVLLERGADVNLADQQMQTPLIVAAAAGASNIVTLLKKFGADVNIKDKQGPSAADRVGLARSEGSAVQLDGSKRPTTAQRALTDQNAALQPSTPRGSPDPGVAVYASMRPAAAVKSSPSAASNRSRSNVGSLLRDSSVLLDGTNGGRASIASAKQASGESDENSWCSSEEERQQKAIQTQPKKVNLVKMLETFGNEGKAKKVGSKPAVDAESSAWSDSDSDVHKKQPQSDRAMTADTAQKRTAAAAGDSASSEEDSAWDSDAGSKGSPPVLKEDVGKQQQQLSGVGRGGNTPVAVAVTARPTMGAAAASEPSAPPLVISDNDDGGWDSDTTSKQISPRGHVQKDNMRLAPNHDAKGSYSDWDSDGEAMSARTPRGFHAPGTSDNLLGSPSINSNKPADGPLADASTSHKSHARLMEKEDTKEKELAALKNQAVNSSSKTSPEEHSSVEHQKTAAATYGSSSTGCKCSELTAELLESRKALRGLLDEKESLLKQLDDAHTANKNSIESLNIVMKQKDTLTISNQELESRLQTTMQRLGKEEEERAALQTTLTKLRDEQAMHAQQHARDLAVERQSAQQKLEESLRELSQLKTQILQLESYNQVRPAAISSDFEETHLRLKQQNSELVAQLSEANSSIDQLRSAVARLEAQNSDSSAKINTLIRDLGTAKSERQQLLLQNQEQCDLQTKKIAELQDQNAGYTAEMKKQQNALSEAKQSYDDKFKALLEEAQQSASQVQVEQAARSRLESSVAAVQEQLKNAGSEVHLSSEALKNMERKHQQDLLLIQQMLNKKEQELQELQNTYEELRQRHSNTSNDLHHAQEKVLAQATTLAERSSVIVQLRAALLEQTQAIESMDHETASDKKKLATMQAQMELLQDQLQRLKHRKLVSASQSAIDGLLNGDSELKPRTGSQVRSPTKIAHLKELLANAEQEIVWRDREISGLHEQLADVSTAKDELALQARELEAQLHDLESVLAVERRGNETLRAQLAVCVEQSQQMQSAVRSGHGGNSKLMLGDKESAADGEVLVSAYSVDHAVEEKMAARSAATLERKLLRESKRCAELTHHNSEMKTKLKLVKLYLREMAVHHALLQGSQAAAVAADDGRRAAEILNQTFTRSLK